MDYCDNLFDFLYERAYELIPENEIKLQSSSPLDNNDFFTIPKPKGAESKKQIILKRILKVIHELTVIVDMQKNSPETLSVSIDFFLNQQILRIADKKIEYNTAHPLYGYKPFTDKLLLHYIKTGDYESCVKIDHEMLIYYSKLGQTHLT